MTTNTAVQITLPELTQTEAAHLHDALYDLLLIIDAYYADPGRRINDHSSRKKPPCATCPLRGNNDDAEDNRLPF